MEEIGSEKARPFSNWNWTNFCPTGLTPWLPDANYLTPCFQQICLQLPMLLIFAIISAYYFGRQKCLIARNQTQIRLIYVRVMAALLMAFLPLVKIYFMISRNAPVYPIDVLIVCAECVTWIVHCGFLLSLRSHGSHSHRGPLIIGVLWITLFLLSGVWLRTSMLLNKWSWASGFLVLHCVYAISLIPGGKAVIIDRGHTEEERQVLLGNTYYRFQDDINGSVLGHAQDDASWLSQLVFSWVNPLIDKGVAGHLRKIDDLFDLPESLTVTTITERLQIAIDNTKSMFRALHRSFGYEFYLIGIIRFSSDMSSFAGPLLLGALLKSQTTDKTGSDMQPYLYALALFGSTLYSAISDTHFNWRIALVGLKMRMSVITAIYRKALEARSVNESYPDVLNLMSTDTDRIVQSCIGFHSFWSIPFQLFMALYLLYTQIGIAFIAGVCFATALIPINRWIANAIQSYSQGLMSAKDARISLTTEAMAGAKQIKLLTWEKVFIEKIQALRAVEIKYLSKRKYLDALCVYFWATTPILMCLLTFVVSTLLGTPLNASTVFTSVALLNLLIGPLNAFPWVLNGMIEAWVSLKRVQKLIDIPNVDLRTFYTPFPEKTSRSDRKQSKSYKPTVISVRDATFVVERSRNQGVETDLLIDDVSDFKLDSVNLEVKMGELVCIEGPVGAGKSVLLAAILGDINRISGSISISDIDSGVAYVAQSAWLQRGTIRENIVWGEIFDENRYKKVLFACALHKDIEVLDESRAGIGEGGRTLSGGQRARIALARAVYQKKQIYIIDDVLASLDAHVTKHVVKYCILGLLRNTTCLIVTENRTLFYYANRILHVENGHVRQSDIANGSSACTYIDEEIIEDVKMPLFELNDDGKRSVDSVLLEESKEYGTLAPRVFRAYWKAMGGWIGLLVILSVILMQATKNFSDAWLAYWIADINPGNMVMLEESDDAMSNTSDIGLVGLVDRTMTEILDVGATVLDASENSTAIHDPIPSNSSNFYILIYAAIALTNSVVTLFRAFIFAYAGIKAAKFMHTELLTKIFYTKFQFFDVTPLGRILNRFSSDTYAIDDSLPFILNILLAQVVGLLGALIISLYAMPWLALIVVPITPIYLSIQNRYRHSSRDIKRLSSNALSPLYAHFTETLQGMSTIRAMRAENRFLRDFLGKLEESIRAQLTANAAVRWLGLRLKCLGAFLVGGAGFVAAITSAHASNPEMVGLAISYALSITGLLAGVLNAVAETEQELVAIERVDKYCTLLPEKNAQGSSEPSVGWPCQGVVAFDNVTLRYREHLSPALLRLNLKTASCERVGIVGRTGAGKSSILAALLRVAPVQRGRIYIDGVDISTLPIFELRGRVAVVPQDPFLFTGTIRENLDPTGIYLDSQMWDSIGKCLSTPMVQSLGGLGAQIDAAGANLSAGQKQLLCLSRALLKRRKIVVIDEGTSNLDSSSEQAIQLVLQHAFKNSTVLFIAHRLNGLQQVDRIIVMEDGEIVEEGAPQALSNDINSRFHAMLEEQQNEKFQDSFNFD